MASLISLVTVALFLGSLCVSATPNGRQKRGRSFNIPETSRVRGKRACTERTRANQPVQDQIYERRTTRSFTAKAERKNYAEYFKEEDTTPEIETTAVQPAQKDIPQRTEPPKTTQILKERPVVNALNISRESIAVLEIWIFRYYNNCYHDPIHSEYLGEICQKDEHDPFCKLPLRFPDIYRCRYRHEEPWDCHLLSDDPWRSRLWREQDMRRIMNDRFRETKALNTDWLTPELMEESFNFDPTH